MKKLSNIPKYLKLLLADRPFPLEKPKVIQFPVIDICNSRCQMCRIWENKKSTDISVENLKIALANDLFSDVQSIGFNGGEPTLRKDLSDLVQVVVDSLSNLKGISIITNAFKYKDVIEQIEKMGIIAKSKNLKFDVMVSLDGYQEKHDLVRGKKGNFERAVKVIDFVASSPLVDTVRIGCTVIRENVFHLADLLDHCIKKDLYIKYRLGVPHQRLYTQNLLDPYALTFEEKYEFVEFLEGLIQHYEKKSRQNFFYRSLIDQIIHHAPRRAGCDWQYRGATITAKGELAFCAVQSKVISDNVADDDIFEKYFEHESELKRILSEHCDSCHHDYVGFPNRKDSQKIFLNRVSEILGLKSKAKRIPGFTFLNNFRLQKKYSSKIERFRNITKNKQELPSGQNILICGWYGTETLGDKAIIGGIIQNIRLALGEDVVIHVASLNTYITERTKLQMSEFNRVKVIDIDTALSLAAKMDVVLFGGGPLMALNDLASMQVIFEKVNAAGIKTIAAGVGVGPLGSPWHNESIAKILNLSTSRIYRDHLSKDYALKLGVNAQDDVVAEDPAFTWLSQISDYSNEIQKSENKVLLLGLREFPFTQYAKEFSKAECHRMNKEFENKVLETLNAIVQQHPNIVIKPVPMCTNHFGGDDRWFYRRLFNEHAEIESTLDRSLLGKELTPLEYCKAFQGADAILSMRFHSLVFGLGLGLNTVALDYTLGRGKVASLAEKHSVTAFSLTNFSSSDLTSALNQALAEPRPKVIQADELNFKDSFIEAITSK